MKEVDILLDIFATLQQPINITYSNRDTRAVVFTTDHLSDVSMELLKKEYDIIYVNATHSRTLEVLLRRKHVAGIK